MHSLMCVKSIMTIMVTLMLCVLTYVYPDVYAEVFKNVAIMVATFYFSHQSQKSNLNGGKSDGMDNNRDIRPDMDSNGNE